MDTKEIRGNSAKVGGEVASGWDSSVRSSNARPELHDSPIRSFFSVRLRDCEGFICGRPAADVQPHLAPRPGPGLRLNASPSRCYVLRSSLSPLASSYPRLVLLYDIYIRPYLTGPGNSRLLVAICFSSRRLQTRYNILLGFTVCDAQLLLSSPLPIFY